MKKLLTKNNLSNVVFVLAIAALLYTPSRVWIMRQIAFTPSITKIENRASLDSYNWYLKGLNTTDVNFNNLKGKVIFVNFWATWCPSCIAEKPMLQKLYHEFKDEVVFLFVTNEDLDKVNSFYETNGYDFPTYNSGSVPPVTFTQTNSIPASYLIDDQGKLVIRKTGAGNWDSNKIRNLLIELTSK